MVRVEAGPTGQVEDTRIFDERSKGFLDVSTLNQGDGAFADLIIGGLDGVVLSWHVAI